jgi:hypothetical protein
MSRLDRHVSAVQTRMTLTIWLWALAWAGIIFAIVVWSAILIDKLVQVHLPRQVMWLWIGAGITVAGSLAFTIWRRPGKSQAAVAIDERLALKEKFSTALYIRPSRDPFAMAAVLDAERTADSVNLQKKFPVQMPLAAAGTVVAILAVVATALFLPTFDLFGVQASRVAKTEAVKDEQRQARDAVHRAIAEIDAAPKAVADKPEIQLAKRDLVAMRNKPSLDPQSAKGTAEKAVENVQKAIKEKIEENKNFAVTQQEMREFQNMTPPADETGPMADAHRDLAAGKLDQAVEDLSKAVNGFDKMDPKQQEKAAQQAKAMANALKQMANDPKVQQNIQKQMQKMGANQQQQQQAQNLMQQAAAGNQQAAQQLQQMAKQLAQQANQNGKMSPQQQRQAAQQAQNAMQQMQQKVNTQMNAQQLAGASQALAQAMQQGAQGGKPGQAQQGQQGQQANSKGQQGNKPGQQQGNQQQQMANAGKQMQQQLQQMQATANDAQQVAAGQQNAGGQDGDQAGQNGQPGNQPGNGKQPNGGNGQGPWGKGNNQNQGPAQGGGGGVAMGNNRPAPAEAPFQTKNETDISQKDEKGKVLASSFVKAGSIKGDAKMQLHDVLPSVDKDATDEIGEQRVPRQDQDVVRGYFGNLEKDTQQK